jgi:uncharacterized protein (TIGR02588 family)
MTETRQERHERGERRGRSFAEWTTFTISVVLILAFVGLVAYLARADRGDPPVIEAMPRTDEVRQEGNAYYLPIAVTNLGSQTAETVLVRAEFAGGAGDAETAEFTIDFLASDETAEGTVVFAADPRAGELTVAVISFQPP